MFIHSKGCRADLQPQAAGPAPGPTAVQIEGVASAELQRETAKATCATALEPASDATLASDRASVASEGSAVATVQAALDGASITAPVDGMVVTVNIAPGMPAPSGDAITLQMLSMEVTSTVTESDLPSLQLGQSAAITISAIGEDVTGRVIEINPVAATTGASSVATYSVTVALVSTPSLVRSGMSASISIATASAADVIAIPVRAPQGSAGN
jgi:multidrug resistance efflux pump